MDGATARSRNQSEGTGADDSVVDTAGMHEVGEDGLTRREHDILSFERQWWKYAGAKEEAIKELFDMSATRATTRFSTPWSIAPNPWRLIPCWSSACVVCVPADRRPGPPVASASRSPESRVQMIGLSTHWR